MQRIFPWIVPLIVLALGGGAALVWRTESIHPSASDLPPASAPENGVPAQAASIRLMFAGDIMLSREVGSDIKNSGDWRYPFLKIASTTSAADMFFANLETPVSDRGTRIGSIYSFRSDPHTLAGLSYAGVDVVSLANNHIWDYSKDALLDTMQNLKNSGIAYAGAGEDYQAAHTPAILDVGGTRVAVLAYTNLLPKAFTRASSTPASAAYDDWNKVAEDIKDARGRADIVIVSFHWGEEYQTRHNADQEKYGHAAIDAGADIVVGSHPHVEQETERYGKGIIAYSLGNFVFDQYFQPEVMRSKILEVDFKDGKISAAKEWPIFIGRYAQPEASGPAVPL